MKRKNISPSGWLSNLGKQKRTPQSLVNEQNNFIRMHRFAFQAHRSYPAHPSILAEIERLGLTHLIGTL